MPADETGQADDGAEHARRVEAKAVQTRAAIRLSYPRSAQRGPRQRGQRRRLDPGGVARRCAVRRATTSSRARHAVRAGVGQRLDANTASAISRTSSSLLELSDKASSRRPRGQREPGASDSAANPRVRIVIATRTMASWVSAEVALRCAGSCGADFARRRGGQSYRRRSCHDQPGLAQGRQTLGPSPSRRATPRRSPGRGHPLARPQLTRLDARRTS